MANVIRVTPEELLAAASKVESWADSYLSIYNRINSTVNDLASTWGGEAHQQYVAQLDGFQDDFNNLYTLLNKYGSYLRDAAAKYQQAEENIKSSASSLSTGI
ncbi:MAG: WXG100 family type VII secretion target [Lachnospirales bacterium]